MKRHGKLEDINAAQLAKMLGVSDEAVYKKIKIGAIKARKVGRNYLIDRDQVPEIVGAALSDDLKRRVDASVKQIVKQYGETLRLLGRE